MRWIKLTVVCAVAAWAVALSAGSQAMAAPSPPAARW